MFDFDKFKEDCGGFTNCLLCPFEKSCTDAFKDPENDDLPPCEKWDREKLLRRAIGSEPRVKVKVCRFCGCKIVDGENGCTMAGDVCFTCRPWNMKTIPAARAGYDDAAADYWEGQILARQDQYWND